MLPPQSVSKFIRKAGYGVRRAAVTGRFFTVANHIEK